jgi:hypothetical protein
MHHYLTPHAATVVLKLACGRIKCLANGDFDVFIGMTEPKGSIDNDFALPNCEGEPDIVEPSLAVALSSARSIPVHPPDLPR